MALGTHVERFTTWTITGVAAITALLLSNRQSLSTLVCPTGLRAGLLMFIASMAIAVVSKQLGASIEGHLSIAAKIEEFFRSPSGFLLMSGPPPDLKKLREQIVQPHWWPMSWLMRRGFNQGSADVLYAEKKFIKLFNLQLITNLLHLLLAAAALVTITLSATSTSGHC